MPLQVFCLVFLLCLVGYGCSSSEPEDSSAVDADGTETGDGDPADDGPPEDGESTDTSGGTASLTWVSPTRYDDGSDLDDDLAGYRIYIGLESGRYHESITVMAPGISGYVVEGLTPGRYFFAVTTLTTAGLESVPSSEVVKEVLAP